MTLLRRPAQRTPYSIMRGDGGAIEGAQAFVFAELAQAAAVLADDVVVHLHLFVELDAHFENFAEILFVGVEQFVECRGRR